MSDYIKREDTISRQAAIDAIHCDITITGRQNAELVSATIGAFADRIKALPSAQQWIPCSERLPEEEKKTYWVCTDTEYQCECRWTNNRFGIGEGEWGWSIFDTPQYTKPIAWMPLPEPYKGEQE